MTDETLTADEAIITDEVIAAEIPTRWTRNVANRATDTTSIPPEVIHHPDIAKLFEPCPAEVQNGWHYWDGAWHEEEAPRYHTEISIFEFKTLFTVEERIRLKKARKGTEETPADEILNDYWELMEEYGKVDLEASFTEEALNYLVSAKYITENRKETIKKGVYY